MEGSLESSCRSDLVRWLAELFADCRPGDRGDQCSSIVEPPKDSLLRNLMAEARTAPPRIPANLADVSSLDGIVQALYESVSFSPGTQPNFDRLRSLFHPEGRLTPPKDEREKTLLVLDVETFIKRSWEYLVITGLERKGFCEVEVARRTHAFRNIVHLFSTYESRHSPTDRVPIQRGINSIQLVKDLNRWWAVSIVWDVEDADNPIPEAFLV